MHRKLPIKKSLIIGGTLAFLALILVTEIFFLKGEIIKGEISLENIRTSFSRLSLKSEGDSIGGLELSGFSKEEIVPSVKTYAGFNYGYLNYTICNPSDKDLLANATSGLKTDVEKIKGDFLTHSYKVAETVSTPYFVLVPNGTITVQYCYNDYNLSKGKNKFETICENATDVTYASEKRISYDTVFKDYEPIGKTYEKNGCVNIISYYTYDAPILSRIVLDDVQDFFGVKADQYAVLNASYLSTLTANETITPPFPSANDTITDFINLTSVFYINGSVVPNSTARISDLAVHTNDNKLLPFQVLNFTQRGADYSAVVYVNTNKANISFSWNSTVENLNVTHPFGYPVIGMWTFEDGILTSDLSTKANTVSDGGDGGQNLVVSPKFGTALEDTAASNNGGIITVNSGFTSLTNFTVCADFKPTNSPNSGFAAGMDGCGTTSGWMWLWANVAGGAFLFGTRGDSDIYGSYPTGVTINTWWRICTTYDRDRPGNNKYIYINGVQREEQDTNGGFVPCNDGELTFGYSSNPTFSNDDTTAVFDNIILYNVSLTADQIKRDYEIFSAGRVKYGVPEVLAGEEDVPPRIDYNYTNTTVLRVGGSVLVGVNVSDDNGLSFGFVESNVTGTLANVTVSLSGTSMNFSANFSIGLKYSGAVLNVTSFKIYVNDTQNQFNASEKAFYAISNSLPAVTAPTINDSSPVTTSVVNCTAGTYSDADGNSQGASQWQWFNASGGTCGGFPGCDEAPCTDDFYTCYTVCECEWTPGGSGGNLLPSATSQTLDLSTSGLNEGEYALCSQQPYDGFDYGEWSNSSAVQVGITYNYTTVSFTPIVCSELANTSNTYSVARTAAKAYTVYTNSSGATMLIGNKIVISTYIVGRIYCSFNTASIPNNAEPINATLYANVSQFGVSHFGDRDFTVVNGSAADPNNPVVTDFPTVGGSSVSADEYADRQAVTSAANAWVLHLFELNSAGVDRVDVNGVTEYGLRAGGDIDGTTPIDDTEETSIYLTNISNINGVAYRGGAVLNVTYRQIAPIELPSPPVECTCPSGEDFLLINEGCTLTQVCNITGYCLALHGTSYLNIRDGGNLTASCCYVSYTSRTDVSRTDGTLKCNAT